jgi:hypothetical protein
MGQLFEKLVVLQQQRAAWTGCQRILVVGDRGTARGRQRRRFFVVHGVASSRSLSIVRLGRFPNQTPRIVSLFLFNPIIRAAEP